MGVLSNCEPKRVLYFFEEICKIPHGSGDTAALAQYCVRFAEERGLPVRTDACGNVVIVKDAAKGYEDAPPMILQGHLDMVCQKDADCEIDFQKDGLSLYLDGDWIRARGTTLGADDGIAPAFILAILESDLPHPKLEAVLTVDEETRMTGAAELDYSQLAGRRMINLDTNNEGVLVTGCAGGLRAECALPVTRKKICGAGALLTVDGLKGGHSGAIHNGRGNANQLLARTLYAMKKTAPFYIETMEGGDKDNAVPRCSRARLICAPGEMARLGAVVAELNETYRRELAVADPGVTVTLCPDGEGTADAVTLPDVDRIIFALLNAPHGIQAMSREMPGMVQTSLNLGILHLQQDALRFSFCVRSCIESQKQMVKDRIDSILHMVGGTTEYRGDYPAWELKKDSPLLAQMTEIYERLFGKTPTVKATHGGLECGFFYRGLPGLDCISAGPTAPDIHTTRERLSVSSMERTWRYLTTILAESR